MEKMTSTPLPPAVTIARLTTHFKGTYQLGEDQVELMIRSSKKSLDKILADAEIALVSADVCGQFGNIGHSLKGLLLNMGELQWAEAARALEKAAKAGEEMDYAAAITAFRVGMAAVTAYGDEQ